jgi:transposase
MASMQIERLDHLGIVAGVSREIGQVEYFDALDTHDHERVSQGQAVLALILNGLGFSNRQLYLIPQFFTGKPIAHLLGPGIAAEDLNDDRLGRALDWLTKHDLTRLFAGLALRARAAFGVPLETIHVDTTSFSVYGDYPDVPLPDTQLIQITYGYSRDHRADLKQWLLALATAGNSDIPIGLQVLSGNASDKAVLVQQISQLMEQLQGTGDPLPIFAADSGLYSVANMQFLSERGVLWITRVPETSQAAKAAVRQEPAQLHQEDTWQWWETTHRVNHRFERWIVARSDEGMTQHRATVQRQAKREQAQWQQEINHLGPFACQADAEATVARVQQAMPPWFHLIVEYTCQEHYGKAGRPAAGATPTTVQWQVRGTVQLAAAAVEREARRRAWYIVATNVEDLPAVEILRRYAEQHGVERGFAFLKDPLFLASSVFVQKHERVMAIGFIMVCCLLLYRLAEYRIREQLALRDETLPNQLGKPTQRPTLRWLFQCFEGIHLVTVGNAVQVVGLTDLHQQVLTLLGPPYQQIYEAFSER